MAFGGEVIAESFRALRHWDLFDDAVLEESFKAVTEDVGRDVFRGGGD